MPLVRSLTVGPLLLILALTANGLAAEEAPNLIDRTSKVSAEQVIDLLDEHDDLVIIDSSKPSDRSQGFIENSIPLPYFDTTQQTLAMHIQSKQTPVVFYCNGVKCGRSVTAATMAVEQGYSQLFWFRGD